MCPSREAQKSLGRCFDDPFVCLGNPICVELDKKLGNRTKSKESVVKSPGSLLQPLAKHLSAFLLFFPQNNAKVAVLGASGGIGQPLSLLLKNSPLVSRLSLYDIAHTPGVAADLSHIETRATVKGLWGCCHPSWEPKPAARLIRAPLIGLMCVEMGLAPGCAVGGEFIITGRKYPVKSYRGEKKTSIGFESLSTRGLMFSGCLHDLCATKR